MQLEQASPEDVRAWLIVACREGTISLDSKNARGEVLCERLRNHLRRCGYIDSGICSTEDTPNLRRKTLDAVEVVLCYWLKNTSFSDLELSHLSLYAIGCKQKARWEQMMKASGYERRIEDTRWCWEKSRLTKRDRYLASLPPMPGAFPYG